MLTDEEHAELIAALRELQARITMRGAPSTALWTAIRALETSWVRVRELERMLAEAEARCANPPPDSLY